MKTNECKLFVGLRRVLIQIDILLIQPFLPILWPKTVQMAINGPLVAISWPGGSEMADQRGSRLDQVRTHPGGCVGTISRVRNGHWGAHFRIFVFLHFCNFQQKNENFANLEIPLLLSRTTLLCVFSTGEPCKDRLILTAIPSKFGAHGFAVLLFLFDGADIF